MPFLFGRYLTLAQLSLIALVSLVVLAIDRFVAVLSGVGGAATGASFWWALVLPVPERWYAFFPLFVLLGAAFSHLMLARQQEYIAWRAGGAGWVALLWASLPTAALLVASNFLLSEWLIPQAAKMQLAMEKEQVLQTDGGLWLKEGAKIFHVEAVLQPSLLQGVTVYTFDSSRSTRLHAITGIARAYYEAAGWRLEDIHHRPLSGPESVVEYRASEWRTVFLSPRIFSDLSLQPQQQTLAQLWSRLRYRQQSGLDERGDQLLFWGRLAQPLLLLLLLALSLSIVFWHPRLHGDLWSRAAGLIFLGLGLYLLQQIASNIAVVYGLWPVLGVWGPVLALAGFMWWWLQRAVRRG